MDRTLTLRPLTPADQDFLYCVYASTRQGELSLTNWDESQKSAFLQMQFKAQHQYYLANYPQAQYTIVALNDEPIGRLYLDRRAREIRIVDIALLPTYRKQGIGSVLFQDILAEGQRRGVPVTIHVERFNAALRLYARLGFRVVEDKGVYYFMEWLPHLRESNERL